MDRVALATLWSTELRADRSAVARTLLSNANLIDPEASGAIPHGWLLVENGRIADLGEGEPPRGSGEYTLDLDGHSLAPGLIDLHFHGDLASVRGIGLARVLRATAAALASRGTTAFLATTVSSEMPQLADFVMHFAKITQKDGVGANCLGIHLEGPWIHPAHAGAHEASGIRPYQTSEARELIERAEGSLAMVTLAPEIPGGLTAVEELRLAGLVVAIGHSRANPPCIDEAIARGMTHVTHLFNAMTHAHHRDLGVAGCALTDDRLTADLISDGVHVDPRMVALAATAKRERLCLISDQVGSALGGQLLERDGCVWRTAAGDLAGSAISLSQSVACFRTYTRAGLREAVAAATLHPARVLGVESERGTLRKGARADLVQLDSELRVRATWIAGRRVHPAL
jgi:N-acetylglucosamine-6-phosphate deacetylase